MELHSIQDRYLVFAVMLETNNSKEFGYCYGLLTGRNVKKDADFFKCIINDMGQARFTQKKGAKK